MDSPPEEEWEEEEDSFKEGDHLVGLREGTLVEEEEDTGEETEEDSMTVGEGADSKVVVGEVGTAEVETEVALEDRREVGTLVVGREVDLGAEEAEVGMAEEIEVGMVRREETLVEEVVVSCPFHRRGFVRSFSDHGLTYCVFVPEGFQGQSGPDSGYGPRGGGGGEKRPYESDGGRGGYGEDKRPRY